jgi:type VI protein secretion system component VasK
VNKTVNLVIFFVVASVFNIVLMFGLIIVMLWLVGLIPGLSSNETLSVPILLLGILSSVLLTFLIYGWLMKKAVARFNLEKNVPQLFKKRK